MTPAELRPVAGAVGSNLEPSAALAGAFVDGPAAIGSSCARMANRGRDLGQAGSTANTLQNNVALGDAIDLFDANVACGGDTWKKNVFENRDLAASSRRRHRVAPSAARDARGRAGVIGRAWDCSAEGLNGERRPVPLHLGPTSGLYCRLPQDEVIPDFNSATAAGRDPLDARTLEAIAAGISRSLWPNRQNNVSRGSSR